MMALLFGNLNSAVFRYYTAVLYREYSAGFFRHLGSPVVYLSSHLKQYLFLFRHYALNFQSATLR